MPTIKAVVLISGRNVDKQGLSLIRFRITQNGEKEFINTTHRIEPRFMKKNGLVSDKCPNHNFLNGFITSKLNEFQQKLIKVDSISKLWTALQFKEYLLEDKKTEVPDFFTFARQRIDYFLKDGKGRAEKYEDTLHVLKLFIGGEYLTFSQIDSKFLDRFEKYFLKRGKSQNTARFHLSNIRALFNQALKELNEENKEPVFTLYPFKTFEVKSGKSPKIALKIDTIRFIKNFKTDSPNVEMAKDMFMLMFYLIGMNPKDLFFYNEIVDGRVDYSRFKTDVDYSIRIEPEAMRIIKKYSGVNYMLCFGDNFENYRSWVKKINKYLIPIRNDLKLKKLNISQIRHSWATIAHVDLEIYKEHISKCMGHTIGSKTTDRYIKHENMKIIDRTNRMVIDYVNGKQEQVYDPFL